MARPFFLSNPRATIRAFDARHELELSFDLPKSVLLYVGPDGVKQTRCVLGYRGVNTGGRPSP